MRNCMILWVVVALLSTATVGCERPQPDKPVLQPNVAVHPMSSQIVFLTRDGCVNTPVMRRNLDAAIELLGHGDEYVVVDQGTLLDIDARRGYPTPTILIDDRDLFDRPRPIPPFSAPT